MRIALLALVVGVTGVTGSWACGDDTSRPQDDGSPPEGKADSQSAALQAWRFQSPATIQQLPEEDVATTDALRLAIRGWDQIATAATTDGATSVRIVPRRGAQAPLRILTEPSMTRTLRWLLAPLGVVWHNAIVWDDGSVDPELRVLYHMLEGGVLSTTLTNPADSATITAELSQAPIANGSVFEVGVLRLRVVVGTPTIAGNLITIAPSANKIQLLAYTDPLYDTADVNAVGALTTPVDGRVSVLPGPVADKHVRFRSPVLGIDSVIGLGSTAMAGPGPVVLADIGSMFVGMGDETTAWRINALAVKIIKTGIIGMRRMFYSQPGATPDIAISGQTFNFYVFSPRGTVTLWTVGRVTAPYALSYFPSIGASASNVVLADFPATENDYSEDLATGRNAMSTRTAWAFDGSTLVEGSAMQANAPLSHTGMEGNSVDGGWRHIALGPFSQLLVGGTAGFVAKVPPNGNYRFDLGDASQATFSTFSVFHRLRSWTGAWSERPNRVASLKLPNGLIYGSIKGLHNTDVLAAGSRFEINQVVDVAQGPAGDPAALYSQFALDAVPLRNGMLDLDQQAVSSAPWDLAIQGDQATVVAVP